MSLLNDERYVREGQGDQECSPHRLLKRLLVPVPGMCMQRMVSPVQHEAAQGERIAALTFQRRASGAQAGCA